MKSSFEIRQSGKHKRYISGCSLRDLFRLIPTLWWSVFVYFFFILLELPNLFCSKKRMFHYTFHKPSTPAFDLYKVGVPKIAFICVPTLCNAITAILFSILMSHEYVTKMARKWENTTKHDNAYSNFKRNIFYNSTRLCPDWPLCIRNRFTTL